MSFFSVTIHQDMLQRNLATGYPARLRAALLRTATRLAIDMQGWVKSQKLSGSVLHVRTGNLRQSINQEVAQSGTKTTAIVGTNVEYAGAHEYGFDGLVTVKAHVRRSKALMSLAEYKVKTKTGFRIARSRSNIRDGDIKVNGFMRHMRMPERSFLRSTLSQFERMIENELGAAAKEAWDE
jgi:phage gpG-like protein